MRIAPAEVPLSDEPSYIPGCLAGLRKDVLRSGNLRSDFVVEVVDRLATYPAMATVWKALVQLPDSERRESELVSCTCFAYAAAGSLFPKRSKNSLSSVDNSPASVFNALVPVATNTAKMLKGFSADFATEIAGYDEAITVLEKVAIAAKQKAAGDVARWWQENAKHLPPPGRSRSKKSRRAYFARIMERYFCYYFKDPCDELVTIVEDVVFDLGGELDVDTVRKRRLRRRDSSRL
jgi:hypothetical protein